MLSRLLERVTYANVVATLALFVAVGGSAYAAVTIDSSDVKDHSLKGQDLKANTVTGKQVKEKSLKEVPTAGTALNANAVGGLPVGALEKASRIQFSRVNATPGSDGVVVEWPAMGLRITAPPQGGCAAPDNVTLRIYNTGSDPGMFVYRANAAPDNVPPGSTDTTCSVQSGRWQGAVTTSNGLSLFFDCVRLSTEVRCLSIRSTP
jgi:hypothetical protein